MTQKPCSASPADPARLNVRSTERTFTTVPQFQVTHQTNRASRAHQAQLRTPATFAICHVAICFSFHSRSSRNKCRKTLTKPAIYRIIPLNHKKVFRPRIQPIRPSQSKIYNPEISNPPTSRNPPGTAIFGFVRALKSIPF